MEEDEFYPGQVKWVKQYRLSPDFLKWLDSPEGREAFKDA
jgi:hypothetical protein